MTEAPSPIVAQTLHGYREGHRLLASYGDLTRGELALLERASDLSGYLPQGATFEAYVSGYVCGRYYAFASSWRDTGGARAGTVLTHTLLVLPSLLSATDPWSAGLRHRRPSGPDDITAYTTPSPAPLALEASPVLAETVQQELTYMWFGSPVLPVLWADHQDAEKIARWLWARRGTTEPLGFCTLALQPLGPGSPQFDLLFVPSFARGAFSAQIRSPSWWDPVGARPDLRGLRWVEVLRNADATWWENGRRLCAEYELPDPVRTAMPAFVQLRTLLDRPERDLASTRACLDLVEDIWSAFAPHNRLSTELLNALVDLQPTADGATPDRTRRAAARVRVSDAPAPGPLRWARQDHGELWSRRSRAVSVDLESLRRSRARGGAEAVAPSPRERSS